VRFLFYDSVTRVEKARSIDGVKTFALSEEFLRGHFSKVALIPGVIYIEAMAQLLGWLIILSHDFKLSAIMSLLEGVTVSPRLRPGFQASIHGEIVSTSRRDSLGRAWMEADGEVIASIDRIIYSHFHKVDPAALAERFRYYSGWNEHALF
jgi:3-hydroxymyristoyl/3-hydroxydecanoyl-(acyl carrier protein) dehydratase